MKKLILLFFIGLLVGCKSIKLPSNFNCEEGFMALDFMAIKKNRLELYWPDKILSKFFCRIEDCSMNDNRISGRLVIENRMLDKGAGYEVFLAKGNGYNVKLLSKIGETDGDGILLFNIIKPKFAKHVFIVAHESNNKNYVGAILE